MGVIKERFRLGSGRRSIEVFEGNRWRLDRSCHTSHQAVASLLYIKSKGHTVEGLTPRIIADALTDARHALASAKACVDALEGVGDV